MLYVETRSWTIYTGWVRMTLMPMATRGAAERAVEADLQLGALPTRGRRCHPASPRLTLESRIGNWEKEDLVLNFGRPVPGIWDRALDPEFKLIPQGTG
jgi:hypothetical protein